MKKLIVISIIVLFVGMGFTSISGNQIDENIVIPSYKGNTLYVGGSGPGNYTKIQDAIDNSSDGDTVFVYDDSSPYLGGITIEVSINLIGEDRNTTIIKGFENGLIGIMIKADFVNVTGFKVCKFRWNIASGIYLDESNNCSIYDNILTKNSWGIRTYRSSSNTISNNIIYRNGEDGILSSGQYNYIFNNSIYNNRYGIYHWGDHDNISYNFIAENLVVGIESWDSDNTFFENTIINHKYDYGLFLGDSSRNLILNNYFLNNRGGIRLYASYGYIDYCTDNIISGNIISNCKYPGISLSGKDHNIYNNNITNCQTGISIYSVDSYIFKNNLIGNERGFSSFANFFDIYFGGNDFPENNHICYNNILYNKIGVSLRTGLFFGILKNFYFYGNNFIGGKLSNTDLTKTVGDNYWDHNNSGNYWDDYTGVDDDGDGIGDSPYIIKQNTYGENIDHYPLMEPIGDVPNVTINQVNKAKNFNIYRRFIEWFPLVYRFFNVRRNFIV